MVGSIQMKYTVNIVVRNICFYDMQQVVTNIYIEGTSHIIIENCTFMLNQFIHSDISKSMILITMQTLSPRISFVNCNFYHNINCEYLILVNAVNALPENLSCVITANIFLQRCTLIGNTSPIINILGAMNTSCKMNLFIIGLSVVAKNSGDVKLAVVDVIKTSLMLSKHPLT